MGLRMVLKILGRRNPERDEPAIYPWHPSLMNAQLKAAATTPQTNPMLDPTALKRSASVVIDTEARAIEVLKNRIDDSFLHACQLMFECPGRVVVSGMGKSGHIARKIAATLASTGTPAFFVHPGEASHGDLGMITQKDVVLALSNSGETDELLTILPAIKRQGIPLIVMSGNPDSSLAAMGDVHLDVSVPAEACPLGLAPTASTTAALVMGDALAIALLEARGFTDEDFARSHPAGTLGRRLLLHISDIMHTGDQIPRISADATLSEALMEMTRKGLGMTAIVDAEQRLLGVFTDGDLRRAVDNKNVDLRVTPVTALMTVKPKTIAGDKLAIEAAALMEAHTIHALLVIDAECHVVGALNIHDLLRARVV
jgi:arabinose-5-phosphate isomerase